MAIYHLSVKTVSRSAGRSSTAAAAYRAGVQITDERTGEIHDYARRGGVVSATVVLPLDAPEWAADRRTLWNAAEQAETRRNSTVAREFEVALPAELSPAERQRLACDYAAELVARHGCAADVAIHAPGKEGDNRNHHAHILLTTRRLGADGFGCKTRELDDPKTGKALVAEWRERWATLTNARLIEAGVDARIDHRSHAERGIDRAPGQHQGPAVSAILRRGDQSHVADRQAEQVAAHQAQIDAAKAEAAQIAPALEQAEQALDEAYTAAAWRIRDAQRPDDERLTALNEARDAALRAEGEAERAERARQEQARRQAEADRQAQARPAPSQRPTRRPAAERDDDGPSLGM